MPLAHHTRIVARLLQILGKQRLRCIEMVENGNAIYVRVFPSEYCRPAWSADRIRNETVLEFHPFGSKPVDVWSFYELAPVSTDGVRGMIVRHNEHDVRLSLRWRHASLGNWQRQ